MWVAKALDNNNQKFVSLLYFVTDVIKLLSGEQIMILGSPTVHIINVVCNNSGSVLDRQLGRDIRFLLKGSSGEFLVREKPLTWSGACLVVCIQDQIICISFLVFNVHFYLCKKK